jgi:hypothetical protein
MKEVIMSNQNFHLGGSRRMAEKFPDRFKLDDKTDYDFYGQDTKENRAFLESNGFQLVQADNRDYWDSLLADMYKSECGTVEVLLRSDVGKYKAAFESVDADTFYYRLWKSCPDVKVVNLAAFRASVCAYYCALFNQFPSTILDLYDGDDIEF